MPCDFPSWESDRSTLAGGLDVTCAKGGAGEGARVAQAAAV